ncbi:MAG TPA: sulfite exporter TauE/SafE family protein [Streptosporangiaceae bacterium]
MSHVAVYAIICLAVLVGATVQGGIGLGIGLVGSPVAAMLDPSSMPGSILIASTVFPLFTLAMEWRHIDVRGAGFAIAGRFAGTIVAVWLLGGLPPRAMGIAVGAMVLIAVGLSVSTLRVVANPATLLGAGAIAGVTATTTSIGGPPLALVYQHAPGPRIRATLALFFCVGSGFSLGSLGVAGRLNGHEMLLGLACVPFAATGFALAGPLRRYLDRGRTKSVVLVVAAAAAAVLIVKSLL